jgi:hypothetical protein
MIRKYFSGLLAAFLAVAMVAFTPSEKEPESLTNHTFYYVPPATGDYSKASVEDVSNWKTALSPLPGCPSGSQKACSIEVAESNTTGSGSSRTLNFELDIIPGSGGEDNGHVPNAMTQILNQVDRF